MPITVHCSQCGRSYQLRDELAGKKAKCKCGGVISIPEAPAAPLAPLVDPDPLSALLDESLPPMGEAAPLPAVAANYQPASPAPAPVRRRRSEMNPLALGALIGGGAAIVLIVGLVITLSGGSEEPEPAAAPAVLAASDKPPSGYATPEEAFAAYQKATAAKDWAGQLKVLTPESEEMTVGAVALAAAMLSAMKPELADVLKKQGVDATQLQSVSADINPANASKAASQINQRMRELGAGVKDKVGFYSAVMPAVEKAGKEMAAQLPGNLAQMQADAEQALAKAKLVDLQISGDSARGAISLHFMGRETKSPLEFRRINGGWLMHQSGQVGGNPMLPQGMGP
jgi:hypothetical protein